MAPREDRPIKCRAAWTGVIDSIHKSRSLEARRTKKNNNNILCVEGRKTNSVYIVGRYILNRFVYLENRFGSIVLRGNNNEASNSDMLGQSIPKKEKKNTLIHDDEELLRKRISAGNRSAIYYKRAVNRLAAITTLEEEERKKKFCVWRS